MKKIFLSYAQKDHEIAIKFQEMFKKSDFEVISPFNYVTPGDSISTEISDAMLSSDIIIFLMTENSVNISSINYDFALATSYSKQGIISPIVISVLLGELKSPNINSNYILLHYPKYTPNNIDNILENTLIRVGELLGKKEAELIKNNEIIDKLSSSSDKYIRDSLERLKKNEFHFKSMAYTFYGIGFLLLIGGLMISYSKLNISEFVLNQFIFSFLYTTLFYGFLGIIIKFSFALGKSFMVESLRNSDRIHAIKFGEFYLKAFDNKLNWKEIKEAFQHWNIDLGSEFVKQNIKDYDPDLFSKMTTLFSSINNQKN